MFYVACVEELACGGVLVFTEKNKCTPPAKHDQSKHRIVLLTCTVKSGYGDADEERTGRVGWPN